jgi:CheY-like chemotaxis protein
MTAELTDCVRTLATDGTQGTPPRNPGILIADDMGLTLTLLKLALEPLGLSVWLALSGNDAIALYRAHWQKIDLVLLGTQMPGLDGLQTLTALRRINPQVLACFMADDADTHTEDDLLACGAAGLFHKPFRPAEVAYCLWLLASSAESLPASPPVSLPPSPPAAPSKTFLCDWQIHTEREIKPCASTDKLAPSPW